MPVHYRFAGGTYLRGVLPGAARRASGDEAAASGLGDRLEA